MIARVIVLALLGLFVWSVQPTSVAARHSTEQSTVTLAKAKKKCKKRKHKRSAASAKKKKRCKKKKRAAPAPAPTIAPTTTTTTPPPPSTPTAPKIARVVIDPQGILLPGQGQTKQLHARALDANGNPISGLSVSWSSNHPGTVSVSSTGLATAAVSAGSAQIRATAGGKASSPILATVARPADGALLIGDSQVVGEPTFTDPNADPGFDSTFDVVVTGISPPAIGTLVIDTESKPIVGRVVSVEDLGGGQLRLTLHLVPTAEALPGLEIDENVNLAGAPVQLNPDITADFDVVRSGDTFTFTPKAGTTATTKATRSGPRAGDGEFKLGPFTCQPETTPSSENLPVQLSAPPAFTVEFKPSLEVLWSADELEKLMLHLKPKVSMQAGITVEAAFEGKVPCKVELGRIVLPFGGPVSFLIAGLIPFGVGLEAGGKMNIADAGVSGKAEVAGTVDAGFVCPPPEHDCAFTRDIHKDSAKATPTLDAPSIGDVRFEPSLSLFGYGEIAIGNAFFKKMRLDGAKGKLGLKLGGSFASKTSQIADEDYKSSYKLSLDASASLGEKLGDVAQILGLGSITGVELKVGTDLANSPTGTLDANHKTFQTGDHVKFRANLTGTSFFPSLGPYNVDKVVLVRDSGGSLTEVGSRNALPGETQFDFDFTAPDSGNVDEFYAFVVTNLIPFDLFSLELARAVGHDPITVKVSPASATLTSGATQQFTATVQNAISDTAVDWSATCGSITAAGLYTAPQSGGPCAVTATSREDPTKSGTATVTVTVGAPTVTVVGRIGHLHTEAGCFDASEIKDKDRPSNLPFSGSWSDSLTSTGGNNGGCGDDPKFGQGGSATATQTSDVEPAGADSVWLDVDESVVTQCCINDVAASTHEAVLRVQDSPVTITCTGSYTGTNEPRVFAVEIFIKNPSNSQTEQVLFLNSGSGSIGVNGTIPSGDHSVVITTGAASGAALGEPDLPDGSGSSSVTCKLGRAVGVQPH